MTIDREPELLVQPARRRRRDCVTTIRYCDRFKCWRRRIGSCINAGRHGLLLIVNENNEWQPGRVLLSMIVVAEHDCSYRILRYSSSIIDSSYVEPSTKLCSVDVEKQRRWGSIVPLYKTLLVGPQLIPRCFTSLHLVFDESASSHGGVGA